MGNAVDREAGADFGVGVDVEGVEAKGDVAELLQRLRELALEDDAVGAVGTPEVEDAKIAAGSGDDGVELGGGNGGEPGHAECIVPR